MEAWFQSLSLIQKVFALCAIAGGTIFVLRTVLLLFGLSHDVDSDTGGGFDHGGLNDTDISFHFLTIHGITAFFLMFGLAGLALTNKTSSSSLIALLGGLAAGLFTMWMIALIFSGMRRFQSDGTLRLENAVGQAGVVYLNIPRDGIGKVQITIQGGLKIFDARSEDLETLHTGDRVKVLSVTPDNMLIVEKLVS
jgi:hypothetical protein